MKWYAMYEMTFSVCAIIDCLSTFSQHHPVSSWRLLFMIFFLQKRRIVRQIADVFELHVF